MISIKVICVGSLKEKYLKDGCNEYLKRLKVFANLEVIEISEERISDNPSPKEIEKVIDEEGKRILSKIPKGSFVIPMCIEGKEISSVQFAEKLNEITVSGFSSIVFIIGGSFGLSNDVKNIGNFKQSFGKITLPHQLMRMVLLEQIYRAFSINNHSKYHK